MARFILGPNQGGPTFSEAPADPERRGFLSRAMFAAGGFLIGAAGRAGAAPAAVQGTSQWIGEITIVPYNFAPAGWALCNGQSLSISANSALFSLLGTTYGGDGISVFSLPDLQGRVALHQGAGFVLGQFGGELNHTLTGGELPPHAHGLPASSANGTSDTPTGLYAARNAAGIPMYGASNAAMGPTANAGSGLPHNNLQPYLTLNFIIALVGIFPSR